MSAPLVRGVRWGAVEAGLRKRGGLDLGVVLCERPTSAAAVFTRCQAAAAPVVLSRARVRAGKIRAILVNAGCANACVPDGEETARRCTAALARSLGARDAEVLVASTGVIGARLLADRLCAAVPALVAAARPDGLPEFARAIMTTDTVPKVATRTLGDVTVAGCAKGAGMIMPDMATMLGFLATDAFVTPARLRAILREVAHESFNAVTVDGDTSTNDSLFLLATGAAGKALSASGERRLQTALTEVAVSLARAIARDGEGATKRIEVSVEGAPSVRAADAVARRIANSPLVKTAISAADANWGRIVAAAGTAGVRFDPARLEVRIGDAVVARRGVATDAAAEAAATEHLRGDDVRLSVRLGNGRARRTVWTCDLTADYVRINADYRS